VFLLFLALFIDLVTDQVQPLSRTIALDDTPGDPNKAFLTNFNLQFGFAPVAYVGFGVSLQLQTDQVRLYDTCWWYSLCNFQYRQQYEHTCPFNVDW
jgi:hypothetical protein